MAELAREFERFKTLFNANDLANASAALSKLKVELAKLNFLTPEKLDNAHFLLAREVLEYAVLLTVKEKNPEAFERSFSQLKTFYNDHRHVHASDRKGMLLGLNLLRLLAFNRIGEFHVELETIPFNLHSENVYIRHSIALEQFLMEGSYNKIFEARAAVPAECYSYFMDILMDTTRGEIASCMEKAYKVLKVSEAVKLLRLKSEAELAEFAKTRSNANWRIDPTHHDVHFTPVDAAAKPAIPAMELIHQTLNYAKELERIV